MLLIVNAHPKIEETASFSLNVLQHFLKTFRALYPNEEIEQIDLYRDDVPLVDRTLLSGWEKMTKGEPLTDGEQNVTARSSKVLQQFKRAKKYVVVLPMHNFNIPSKLKDYMDNVLIARETFKYTENGAVGLLHDGRSMLVIQASGSIYTNNNFYTKNEFSHQYLQAIFTYLGLEYNILRVQGTALQSRDEVLARAYREAEKAAAHYFSPEKFNLAD